MDGNLLLTAPTVQLRTPSDRHLAAIDADVAGVEKRIGETLASVAYDDPATMQPAPPPQVVESVWVEDDVPPGAKLTGSSTRWVTAAKGANVFSGKRALKRRAQGLEQDYYEGGAMPLGSGGSDTLCPRLSRS